MKLGKHHRHEEREKGCGGTVEKRGNQIELQEARHEHGQEKRGGESEGKERQEDHGIQRRGVVLFFRVSRVTEELFMVRLI
jgi:hypothetical protein